MKPTSAVVVLLACALLCGQLLGRVHDVVHLGAPSAHAGPGLVLAHASGHGHVHGSAAPVDERVERTCSLPDGALSVGAPVPGPPTVRAGSALAVACAPTSVCAAPAGPSTPPRARDPPALS